ncbi:MAG: hypothetical protein HY848_18890 [Betaproteobacteria bacterium]|nr:hypothetical protein [Betaproteobacteria bacterium]
MQLALDQAAERTQFPRDLEALNLKPLRAKPTPALMLIWIKPISADATPAIFGNGPMAPAIAFGRLIPVAIK